MTTDKIKWMTRPEINRYASIVTRQKEILESFIHQMPTAFDELVGEEYLKLEEQLKNGSEVEVQDKPKNKN